MFFTAELIAKFGDVYKNLQAIVSIDQIPKTINELQYDISAPNQQQQKNLVPFKSLAEGGMVKAG